MNSTRSARFSVLHPYGVEPHDDWKAAAASVFFAGLDDDSSWPGQELYDMLLETQDDEQAQEVLAEETDAELRSAFAGLPLEAVIDRMQDMAIELQTTHDGIQEAWESEIHDAWLAIAARHVLQGLPQATPVMGEDGPVLDEDGAVGLANLKAMTIVLDLLQAERQVDSGPAIQSVLDQHGISVRPEYAIRSLAEFSMVIGRIILIANSLHGVHCDLVPVLHRDREDEGASRVRVVPI